LAFDKHLNLVLVDSEEYRSVRSKAKNGSAGSSSSSSSRAAIVEERVEKRTLGLIILRGENVVSVAVEGPPPPNMKAASKSVGGESGGVVPGVARGAGRGAMPPQQQPPSFGVGAGAPMGLGAAPVHGVGMMGGMSMPPPPGPPPPPMMMMGRGMPPPPPPGMGRGGGY
jgi:small nuclear ribonucleoprotein B and B'